MQLMILEVLSFVSFYLMVLLVFFQVELIWSMPIYLYSALVLLFFQGKCKKRNWKTTVLLGVSLSLPMLLYFTLERVLFTLLFAIGCTYYYEKFMGRLEMVFYEENQLFFDHSVGDCNYLSDCHIIQYQIYF